MSTSSNPSTPNTPDNSPSKAAPVKKTASQISESDYEQAQLQTVKNGEAVARAAKDSQYNAALLAEGMRPAAPIGVDVFADEDTAGQSVATIIDHAEADALPAITPEKIITYRTQLDGYTGKPGAKTQGQSEATRLRGLRRAKFNQIMNLRHEIQHPADGTYPWQDPLSQGPRKVFKLPAGRPFTG